MLKRHLISIALCTAAAYALPHEAAAAGSGQSLTAPDAAMLRIGVGTGYALFGAQLGAFWQAGPCWQVGPLVAIGGLPAAAQAPGEVLGALGLQARYGSRHRLVLDAGYEPIAFERFMLHGVVIRNKPIYALGLRFGYEYLWRSGFHLHIAAGPAWEPLRLGPVLLASLAVGLGFQWGGTQ